MFSEFKEQTAEIEMLKSHIDRLSEEKRIYSVKAAELEYELEQRDYLIAVKTDGADELQEKLDYMENVSHQSTLVLVKPSHSKPGAWKILINDILIDVA